jgi:GT2 family glycosyltransferase
MPDLAVTICSWNTRDDLRACLESLQRVRTEADFEVIVVDNDSEDHSADMVETDFPWVRLERMRSNLGFAKGHNHAFSVRTASDVFPLNSDTVVHPGALANLLAFARKHPEAGIIGPKLLNTDGSLQFSCRRFPNPVAALFRNTPIGKLFPNNRFTRDYLMQDWDHTRSREVDWVSGAAFYVRGEVLNQIGGFDEEYFMFCEDVDWCWRAWKAGFMVLYFPDSVITHAIGRSTDKVPNRMIGRFHRSMLRFYTKNMLPQRFILWRPFAWCGAAIAIAMRASVFIFKNKLDAIRRRFSK